MSKTNAALKSRAMKSAPEKAQAVHIAGATFALLPWEDYEKLLAADIETEALIAAGEAARNDTTFPEEVARRLVAGETPLRVIREWRGLTQERLFDQTGVAVQYISQLERRADGRNVGRKTAAKLAPALKVEPEDLME